MKRFSTRIIAPLCSCIVSLLFLGNTSFLSAQEVYVCVWRNPERTMTRLFPAARDYQTVSLPITSAQLAAIESASGTTVLPGQRTQFQYFVMLDSAGATIGYTAAVTQKGEYGAIEFIIGLDRGFSVTGMYIQRARERHNQFREEAFLRGFAGKSICDIASISDPYGAGGNYGTRAIVQGLRKELAAFAVLVAR